MIGLFFYAIAMLVAGGLIGREYERGKLRAKRRSGWFLAKLGWDDAKECTSLRIDNVGTPDRYNLNTLSMDSHRAFMARHFMLALTKRKLTLLWKRAK